jgi:hypothetical protein
MANVKQLRWRIVFAIPVILYFYLLYFDFNTDHVNKGDRAIINIHIENIKRLQSKQTINNFIFGGSNSAVSLSARDLSVATGEQWYNASTNAELRTVSNYNQFIAEVVKITGGSNVRNIVFSSVKPFFLGSTQNYLGSSTSAYVSGRPVEIRPQRSGFSYIKEYFMYRQDPGPEGEFNSDMMTDLGDFEVQAIRCHFLPALYPFKMERIDVSARFLAERFIFLATTFSKANIFLVLPSMYFSDTMSVSTVFERDLHDAFVRIVSREAPSLRDRVFLIFQANYPSEQYICSDPHHATPLGRTWRTADLVARLVPFWLAGKTATTEQ